MGFMMTPTLFRCSNQPHAQQHDIGHDGQQNQKEHVMTAMAQSHRQLKQTQSVQHQKTDNQTDFFERNGQMIANQRADINYHKGNKNEASIKPEKLWPWHICKKIHHASSFLAYLNT